MSAPIYVITAMVKEQRFRPRSFGFYHTLAHARAAVTEDRGGMRECLYDYLVIEETMPGIHAEVTAVNWFEWRGDGLEKREGWRRCAAPEWSIGVTNWGIG